MSQNSTDEQETLIPSDPLSDDDQLPITTATTGASWQKPNYNSKEQKELVAYANEVLDLLEHSHRTDLTTHLYSSFLLRKLLFKANEKKHLDEITHFYNKRVGDSWYTWPNPDTILDPHLDNLYEDFPTNDQYKWFTPSCLPSEVSENALSHATDMLNLELSAHWQRTLCQSARLSEEDLDVDKLGIPTHICQAVVDKLDQLFAGLHFKNARRNTLGVIEDAPTGGDKVDVELDVTGETNEETNVKYPTRLTYHDIIERGCEMGEDMAEIYMKSLELYNDLLENFDEKMFKIPKKILKLYRDVGRRSLYSDKSEISATPEEYLELGRLIESGHTREKNKRKIRKLYRREALGSLYKKTFYEVRGFSSDSEREKEDVERIIWTANRGTLLNLAATEDDDTYSLDDCIVRKRRRRRRRWQEPIADTQQQEEDKN